MSNKYHSRKPAEPQDGDDEDLTRQWQEFPVPELLASSRFDVALVSLCGAIPSRSVAAKLIESSNALLNGMSAKCSERPNKGDIISLNLLALENQNLDPEPERIPLAIIYEDDCLLVIDKPPGLVVHPGAGVRSGTLVNAVLSHCGHGLPSLGGPVRAGIVHRLDKETSGVMVVAKTLQALTSLSAQFSRHEQTRRYLALVNGTPVPSSGRIETWHGRDPRSRVKFAVLPPGQGKQAIMDYETLEKFSELCSLQACTLLTGRTHQIRVQMRHLGCAILGDPLYGAPHVSRRSHKDLWMKVAPQLTRQMLHAQLLSFQHPASGRPLTFECLPPEDFMRVLREMRQSFSGVKDAARH